MKLSLLPFVASVLLLLAAGSASASDPCLECHEEKTPGIVKFWKQSVHFQKTVTCTDCHGKDVEKNHNRQVIVDAEKCGECHKKALGAHRVSKHGIGLKTGTACTRNIETSAANEMSCTFCHKPGSATPVTDVECAMFLAQSPEMRRQGCNACHMVEVRCDTCHTKHGTDLALAGSPDTCGVCHMGPDHPQLEMWETSLHGVLYRNGQKKSSPSCVTCHMDGGSHNVSRGIATGLPEEAAGLKTREREFMLSLCSRCHTERLARRNLDDADKIEAQSRALVEEAREIIENLEREGLLFPKTEDRPPHPVLGTRFVIGPHMLYENLSLVESLYFRMKQFYYISAFKGVFHQNPDYAHWYGNAPLKLSLSEIKSEAALLRKVDRIEKRLDMLSLHSAPEEGETGELRESLRILMDRRLRGEMTREKYEEEKNRILEEKGL